MTRRTTIRVYGFVACAFCVLAAKYWRANDFALLLVVVMANCCGYVERLAIEETE